MGGVLQQPADFGIANVALALDYIVICSPLRAAQQLIGIRAQLEIEAALQVKLRMVPMNTVELGMRR